MADFKPGLTEDDYERIGDLAHDGDVEGFERILGTLRIADRLRAYACWVYYHPEPPEAEDVSEYVNRFASELDDAAKGTDSILSPLLRVWESTTEYDED